MNHVIEYMFRSAVRSEDAVRCLNKRVVKLAKCCRRTNTAAVYIGIACLGALTVLAIQDYEIKALQKKVADLEAARGPMENVVDDAEEKNQQKGA